MAPGSAGRRWTGLGLALAVALTSTPAAALEFNVGDTRVRLDITESLFLDWNFHLDDAQILRDEDKSHIFDLRNRLNIRLRLDPIVFGVRLDAAWFPNPPRNPGQPTQYRDDFRPEELFVTGRFGPVTLTLGDDYVTFGRGIALSLRKLDELGFATSLRGIHAQWRHPLVTTRLSAGMTNVVNVDMVEEKFVPDPNDLIVGARVETRPFPWLRVGGHVVDIERRHSAARDAIVGTLTGDDDVAPINNTRFVRTLIGGVNIEIPSLADALSIYAEVDWLRGENERVTATGLREDPHEGFAFYGQVQGFAGPLTILAEFKHYDRFEVTSTLHPATAQQQGITQTFNYVMPPTLERVDQRIFNNHNVTGGRLRLDYAIPDARQSFFVSGLYFVDAPGDDEHTVHVYGGYEHTGEGGNRLLLQAGYRREAAPREDLVRLRMIHLDLDVFHVFSERADMQFHLSHMMRDTNIGARALQDTYLEGTSYVSFNLPPRWSLTAQFEYLTSAATRNPIFPGAFVQYFFTSDSYLRLFVGRSKGGLKCSGGVCRIFPNFEGVRLEATVRF